MKEIKELFSIPNATLRNSLFCLVVILISIYYYGNDLHYKPHGVHSWAQADRYSICLNYYDHGLQFFYPRVNNLAPGPERIASCEPHITGYIAACIAKVFGARKHLAFLVRLVNLLFVLFGLWTLFDLIYRNTHHFIFALIPVFFAFTSPLIIHYSFNFITDTSGLAFCVAAFALLIRYYQEKKINLLYWALAAMTFAALNKMSVAIYFAMFGLLSLYALWKNKPSIKGYIQYLSVAFLGVCIIIGLFLWIKHLKIYDQSGMFLTTPLQFKGNPSEWISYIKKIFDFQYLTYFNQADFYLLPILLLTTITYAINNRKVMGLYITLNLTLMAIALSLIFYLMSGNFYIHDYYLIACGFPFVLILISLGSIGLYGFVKNKGISITLSVILITLWIYQFHIIKKKCQEWRWDIERPVIGWMVEHKTDLTDLGIEKDAKVWVYEDFTPNVGLSAFDRYGYPFRCDTLLNPSIFFSTQKGFSIPYLIVKKETFFAIQQYYPDIEQQINIKEGDTFVVLSQK